jgi:elongation factor G
VAYQETPTAAVSGVEGKLVKRSGGPGQFARVIVDIAPRDDGGIAFEDRTVGGAIPKAFVAATEKGVRAALAEGPRGHPVVGIAVTLVDGETHAVDSSDLAFQRAGAEAVKAALAQCGTTLLEPVMALAIDAPVAHVGDIVGDLQRRNGRVSSIEDKGARVDVHAHAPLASLAGYTTALRSLTQGRAQASMVFHGHEPVRGS